jgi:hypothetical protein
MDAEGHGTMRLRKEKTSDPAPSGFYFEKNFHHDRHSEWKAGNAKNHSYRQLVFAKDIPQQI